MKEKITIVLNEREPEKAKLAERLEAELNARGHVAGRIELTESLLNRLVVRAPTIIITDYVLGDISTGLDLLAAVNTKKSPSKVVFFTDEPSAAVALDALKNGAIDYFLMSSPSAINDLLARISEIISSCQPLEGRPQSSAGLPHTDQIVAESEQGRRWRDELVLAGRQSGNLTVIIGPEGAGRTLSASVIHRLRGHVVPPLSVCWDYLEQPIHEALLYSNHLILNAGSDYSPELVKELTAIDWSALPGASLFVKTTSTELANAIRRFDSTTQFVTVPSIADRSDDISGVVKLSTRELPRNRLSCLSPGNMTKLSEMTWSGQFKQLISTVLGALELSVDGTQDFMAKVVELAAIPNISGQTDSNMSRLRALATLREAGSYKAAALSLGCSISQLRQIVREQHDQ